MASPNLLNSLCGFAPLQHQALLNTFTQIGGVDTITTLNLGSSGVAGTLNLFPATASKGKVVFTTADNAGDTTTAFTFAAQAAARTYTVPDAGASASFMMTQGAQTVVGNNTFTGTTQANTFKSGASGTAGVWEQYPATAASGKTVIATADNAGNTTTTIQVAAQAGARTYTVPDAGASAAYMMTQGAQTIVGAQTFTGSVTVGGIVPASATFTPAAGAANICNVTIQLKDSAGTNLATSRMIDVWLSDANTGIGLTGTTASGTVVAGASGTDIFTYTAKKHLKVQTTAGGVYILEITDAAKTGFYVCAQLSGAGNSQVSAQLVAGNYG